MCRPLICTVLILLQPLSAVSQDRPVRKWKLEHTFDIHDKGVACVACSANLVATLDGSGVIRIWDRATGNLKNKPDRQLEGKPVWLMFTPDGKYLCAASKDVSGMIILMLDVSTDLSKELATSFAETPGDNAFMTFATEGEIWARCNGKSVQLLRMDLLERLKGKPPVLAEEIGALKDHQNSVNVCAFSLDGKVIVTSSIDAVVRVWDLSSQKVRATLRLLNDPMEQIACDSQGKHVSAINSRGHLQCWRIEDGKEQLIQSTSANSHAFSCDGRYLAHGDKRGKISLFELKSGKIFMSWHGHAQSVSAMTFTPDGKALLTGGIDNKAKLWQLME